MNKIIFLTILQGCGASKIMIDLSKITKEIFSLKEKENNSKFFLIWFMKLNTRFY